MCDIFYNVIVVRNIKSHITSHINMYATGFSRIKFLDQTSMRICVQQGLHVCTSLWIRVSATRRTLKMQTCLWGLPRDLAAYNYVLSTGSISLLIFVH